MTRDELEQVQSICHGWLRHAGTANGSRMTIPATGAITCPVELQVRSLLSFDNVLISSAVDANTDTCYAKLIRQPDGAEEIFDTPFEKIPTDSAVASEAITERPTQTRYREAMERLAETQQRDAENAVTGIEPNALWLEKASSAAEQQPKYLLYTNGKLLGYSLLERRGSDGQRSGRFHASDDYFEYIDIFAALPDVENDWMEVNVREAYGIVEAGSDESRARFNELSEQVAALDLYLCDESGRKIDASEVRLEDLSRKYDDESERWLYLTPVARSS
ncbi:MAG TPA: hypothetical protein VLL54_06870 [Pyrinomonadaceae bacterium]|nr:hypothetical protein [Pyrinomonadaceae bacterium]